MPGLWQIVRYRATLTGSRPEVKGLHQPRMVVTTQGSRDAPAGDPRSTGPIVNVTVRNPRCTLPRHSLQFQRGHNLQLKEKTLKLGGDGGNKI